MKKLLGKKQRAIWENVVNMFVLSVLTGLFAGVIVTLYNILANIGEEASVKLYSLVFENPAFVPLLLFGLAAGSVVIGTLVRFVPMIRGSGIPQIEGAARGIIKFRWYITLCSMFAASLACMFMGLAAGAEGPSLEIGGCAGSGVSALLKRNHMVQRLQIAGGASSGLAVAFNAPITGLVFALEEAFRSFSPQVFVCAAVSVICALFTRNALRPALGYSTGFTFGTYSFAAVSPLSTLWFLLGAAVVALIAVAFYHLVFLTKKLFKGITFFKGTVKYIIPFVLAGALGLITVYAMGGGHSVIEALGSGSKETISVLGLSLTASLVIIAVCRFVTAVLAMGCGIPCGVFIPMLAIGATSGAIFSRLFQMWGMDPALSDYFVMVCMAAFFTCVVRAPITGLVMVFELTGSLTNLLPALLGVCTGYLISILFRLEPIYEKCLDMYIDEEKLYEKIKKEKVVVEIRPQSRADGEKIRSIIWPTNGLVHEIILPDGTTNIADGEYILEAGQKIVFEGETDDVNELYEYLYAIVGKPKDKNQP